MSTSEYNCITIAVQQLLKLCRVKELAVTYFKIASSTLIPFTISPLVLLLSTNLILDCPLMLTRSNLAWIRLIICGFKAQSMGL